MPFDESGEAIQNGWVEVMPLDENGVALRNLVPLGAPTAELFVEGKNLFNRQNVSGVKSRGISFTFMGVRKRDAGTSDR